jgi:peptide/nickel transport system substrate-binding protein
MLGKDQSDVAVQVATWRPSRLLSALLVVVCMLAACASPASQTPSGQSAPAQTPRRGGVLRFAELGGAPPLLHPYPEAQQYTQTWIDAATLMWAGLIDLDYNTLDYIVDPRTSMAVQLPTITNNGRTFTFTLRNDIKWSDNQPVTSADFQFAWENASKEENDWIGLTGTVDRIESFTTPDPKTVIVTLKDPLARFLAMGIASGIGPVPKHIWEGKPWLDPQGNPEVRKPSVVSGPYLPDELSAERHSYKRNPNWWGPAPNLDRIEFISASNPTATLELLRTRQVEWAHDFPPSQYGDAKQIPTANVLDWTPAAGSYRVMDLNLNRAPLSDKRFREALARAVNRADLVQFDDDLAVPQYGIFTEASKWRSDAVERYDFDLARSRSLLEQAGFSLSGGVLRDASGQPVRLEIIFPTTSLPRGKIAAYLQQQWKELGIDVAVTGLEFNTFVDREQRQKDFDVAMGTFGSTLDPDSARTMFMTGATQNSVGYSNPRVDQLLEQGAVEQDDTRRKAVYDQIQQILLDDLPMLPLTTTKRFTAIDKKVAGVSPRKGDDLLRDNQSQFMEWYLTE